MYDYQGFLSGIFATAFGVFLNHFYSERTREKAHQKYRKALALIFNMCVSNCIDYVKSTIVYKDFADWSFCLWDKSQLEIAKEFPCEFQEFILLIEALKTISSQEDIQTTLEGLSVLHTKTKVL